MQIVAIGGGNLGKGETLPLDRFVVGLTGVRHPRALFVPTASGDPADYIATFERVYGELLGCRTDRLLLLADRPGPRAIRERMASADLIYVGGGNTLRMMRLWRRLGVDRLLAEAGRRGAVLAGLSAGAICWHEGGHSDSRSFSGREGWAYIRVRGLGLAPGLYCPHLDSERRHRPLVAMLQRRRCGALACDNGAAVHHDGDRIFCRTARPAARAWRYRFEDGRVLRTAYADGDEIPAPGRAAEVRGARGAGRAGA